jgi:hypothetical protein
VASAASNVSYTSNVAKLGTQFAAARKLAVYAAAQEWRSGVISLMTESTPSGRVYPVEGTERYYRASAPGEPPAISSGVYRASWKVRAMPLSVLGVDAAELGTNAVQALALEKGSDRIAPRPHVRQGYERNRERIAGVLAKRWDGIL